jgi:hypothetical protein
LGVLKLLKLFERSEVFMHKRSFGVSGLAMMIGILFWGYSTSAATGENEVRRSWIPTPEAEKILSQMRKEARNYKPRTKKIGIFSRAQLKYGAQRTDFIHRWYDRPLHQNSEWAELANPDKIIYSEAWKRTVQALGLG